jgi:putative methionine-R-sulfoxide reductase with GAF domain
MTSLELKKRIKRGNKALSFDEVERMLISFSTSVLKKESVDDVYWSLAKNVIAKLGFIDCVIYSIDGKTRTLIQQAAYGPKSPRRNEIVKPITIPLGMGITGFVATTGIAERIGDTRKDPRYIVDDEARSSELTIPIKHKERVIGIIDCEHPEKNYFTEQHMRILSAVAAICAVKLSHLEAQRSIQNKESRLLRARQQMAELKIKAIRAQMNPHFVFNALNAVQHFITINDKKNALGFLSAFGKLVRLYLKHAENDVINLYQELDIIDQYLKLQRLRYEGMFDYNISYKGLDGNEISVPGLITQLIIEEGVENLAKNKIAGKMNIGVDVKEQYAHVTIDTVIARKVGSATGLAKRYSNEFTNWSDHMKLLKRINQYKIEAKRKITRTRSATHHTIHVILPCL